MPVFLNVENLSAISNYDIQETNYKILIVLWKLAFSKTLHSANQANPHLTEVIFPTTLFNLYLKVLQILPVIYWTLVDQQIGSCTIPIKFLYSLSLVVKLHPKL